MIGMQNNIYLKKNYQNFIVEINKQIKFLLSNLKLKNDTFRASRFSCVKFNEI